MLAADSLSGFAPVELDHLDPQRVADEAEACDETLPERADEPVAEDVSADPLGDPDEDVALELVQIDVGDDLDSPAWVSQVGWAATIASVVFHVWLLFTLSSLEYREDRALYVPPVISRISEPVPPEEEPEQIVKYELANPDDRDVEQHEALNAVSIGQSQTDEFKNESAPLEVVTDLPDPDRPLQETYDVSEGIQIDDRIVVKGTTGEGLIQMDAALDRVTWEIANNLKEKKVFVVWLLDASGSMVEQRRAVAKRLQRIYGELEALEVAGQIPNQDQPLLSAVATFGAQVDYRTEATADVNELIDAIETTENDESGVENVFEAYSLCLKKWLAMRTKFSRRIMIVMVTDEAGDDFSSHLEKTIKVSNQYGARAYVIGPPAVFGRRQGFIPYVAPEDGRTYQIPVDIGPETAVAENVQMPFWYNGEQFEYVSSGLGPYALSRLVHETGGAYFLTTMVTSTGLTPIGVYESKSMRAFQPDYSFGSLDAYMKDAQKHPLRMALINAAAFSLNNKALGTPRLEMQVTPQNYLQTLSTAQQQVAESTLMIETILGAFPGNMEAEYAKEPSVRWRAAYDLNYGRLLAQKVRNYEYNMACAQMKLMGTQDVQTKSNHWYFRPDTTLNYAPNFKKNAIEAERLLKRVIASAPGTPWALLAARELKDPFGIKIIEKFDPPVTQVEREAAANRNKTVRLANDEQRRPRTQTAPPPKPVLPKY